MRICDIDVRSCTCQWLCLVVNHCTLCMHVCIHGGRAHIQDGFNRGYEPVSSPAPPAHWIRVQLLARSQTLQPALLLLISSSSSSSSSRSSSSSSSRSSSSSSTSSGGSSSIMIVIVIMIMIMIIVILSMISIILVTLLTKSLSRCAGGLLPSQRRPRDERQVRQGRACTYIHT